MNSLSSPQRRLINEGDEELRRLERLAAQGDPAAIAKLQSMIQRSGNSTAIERYTALKQAGGFAQFEQPDNEIKRDLDLILRLLNIKNYFPNTRHNVMIGTELLLEPVSTVLMRAFPGSWYDKPYRGMTPKVHTISCVTPYPPDVGDELNRHDTINFLFSEGPAGPNGPFCATSMAGGHELDPDTYWFNRIRLGLI